MWDLKTINRMNSETELKKILKRAKAMNAGSRIGTKAKRKQELSTTASARK
jgi:hypothetical protein